MELKESVDLVLGAIKGIGKGIAQGLANAGAKVVLNYLDWTEELETLKKDFNKRGREYLILMTTLLKTSAIPRKFRFLQQRLKQTISG